MRELEGGRWETRGWDGSGGSIMATRLPFKNSSENVRRERLLHQIESFRQLPHAKTSIPII